MDKIKFGIIGAGHIGKRHAEMVLRNTNCELTAICDVLPKESLALEPYDVPFYNNYLKMLNSHQEIDVVCVCTPNGSHSDISISVLKHDKHVVIEKPIGLNVANCEKGYLMHFKETNMYLLSCKTDILPERMDQRNY